MDDEEFVLDGLRDTLRRGFEVHTATGATEALAMLRKEPDGYAVVLSDMRMPGIFGSEFLREARTVAPNAVRMLLTGYRRRRFGDSRRQRRPAVSLLDQAVRAGAAVRACIAALAQHRLITAERVLLEQTLRGSVNALVEVLALASPAAFGRAGRVRKLVRQLTDEMQLENRWEVEVAVMLAHIGAVTLPAETAEKLLCRRGPDPRRDRHGRSDAPVGRRLLAKIPRLEGVIAILDAYHDPAAFADQIPSARTS